MTKTLADTAALQSRLAAVADAPRWWVALSGGVDSCALLALLCHWCEAQPGAPALRAIHVNHGMQDAAPAWERHCRSLCDHLQVPLHCARVTVRAAGRGAEAAAREARYRVFEQSLGEGEVLFMAHHLDDQVETFFLRLLRGAGAEGLAAMPVRRPLGAGILLRPLLDVPRTALEDYARRQGLTWVEDPSNSDTALDRNFLRREVLPLLETRWPGYRRTVARAAINLRTGSAPAPPPAVVRGVMGDPGMALAELLPAPPEQVMASLRAWLRDQDVDMPGRASLAEFTRQLASGAEGGRQRLQWGEHVLQRFREALYLLPLPLRFEPPAERLMLAPGGAVDIAGLGRFSLVPAPGAGLALDPHESLRLAWRTGGERCRPAGRATGQSLKKLLQDLGVPPWWRGRIPLFYLGAELVAVGDLWLCDGSRYRGPGESPGPLWQVAWERAGAGVGPAFD